MVVADDVAIWKKYVTGVLDAETVTSDQSRIGPVVGSTVEEFAGASNIGTAGVVVAGGVVVEVEPKMFPKFSPETETFEAMVILYPKSPAPQANPDVGEVSFHGGVEEAGVSQTW